MKTLFLDEPAKAGTANEKKEWNKSMCVQAKIPV
jgi:hypothetical protein